jgi:hypothetical protein
MDLPSLVRLGTALYITRELGKSGDDARRACRLQELKPFLGSDDALAVVSEFDRIAVEAKSLIPAQAVEAAVLVQGQAP